MKATTKKCILGTTISLFLYFLLLAWMFVFPQSMMYIHKSTDPSVFTTSYNIVAFTSITTLCILACWTLGGIGKRIADYLIKN